MRGRPDYLDHEDEDHFDRLVAEAVVKRKVSASDRNGSSHGGLSLDGHQAHIWPVSDASVAPAPLPQFIPMPFKHRDLATFPRRQFVYGRHLARGYVSATIAASGIGKSSLSIAECVAMTPGENLLGIQPAKALKVWYWNGEDPAEEILRRIEATCLHFGVDPELVEGRLFVDSGRDSEIIVANQARSGFVIATPVVDALTEALKNDAFDVLIIDPFVSAHRVGETTTWPSTPWPSRSAESPAPRTARLR